jgi:hypothetical protein
MIPTAISSLEPPLPTSPHVSKEHNRYETLRGL